MPIIGFWAVVGLVATSVIFLLGIITLIFGVRSFKNEGKKYWLTGGIIGFLAWLLVFSFALYLYITCYGGLCDLAFVFPATPSMFLIISFFGSGDSFPTLLISNIINVILFFFIGILVGDFIFADVLIGKLVMKILRRKHSYH